MIGLALALGCRPEAEAEVPLPARPLDPVELGLDLVVDGPTPPLDALLVDVACGGEDAPNLAVVLSPEGEVLWASEPLSPEIGMLAPDPSGGVLVVEERRRLVRLPWAGGRHEVEHDRFMHHDLFGDERGTFVLTADAYPWPDGETYVLDGVDLLSDAGDLLWRWELAPLLAGVALNPASGLAFWDDQFPGARDASHGNGLTPTPDGGLLLSLRWFDAVVKIAGPHEPDAGALRWVLARPGQELPSDFAFAGPEGERAFFIGQHHPLEHPDGTVSVFDNGPGTPSRMARYALFDGVATLVEEVQLPRFCPYLGGAYPTSDGGWLLTCSTDRIVSYAPPGASAPTWTMTVDCLDETEYSLNRARPIDG